MVSGPAEPMLSHSPACEVGEGGNTPAPAGPEWEPSGLADDASAGARRSAGPHRPGWARVGPVPHRARPEGGM